MEIEVIEEKKDYLVLEASEMGHGFCNVLVKELWNDKNIKTAGYHIEHPLIGKTKIIIESKGDARKAIGDSVKRIKKMNDIFKKEFLNAVK